MQTPSNYYRVRRYHPGHVVFLYQHIEREAVGLIATISLLSNCHKNTDIVGRTKDIEVKIRALQEQMYACVGVRDDPSENQSNLLHFLSYLTVTHKIHLQMGEFSCFDNTN